MELTEYIKTMPKEISGMQSTVLFASLDSPIPDDYECPFCFEKQPYKKSFSLSDRVMYRREKCECERKEESTKEMRYIHNITMNNIIACSNMNSELRGMSIEQLDGKNIEPAIGYAKRYLDEFPNGKWLVYSGGVGVGKTHLACSIANELMKKLVNVKFYPIPDLLDEIRESYNEKSMTPNPTGSLLNSDLIILDDLGANRTTDWGKEQIFMLINSMYMRKKSVIITTNCTNPAELEEEIGNRAVDRILHHAVWCNINAISYRKQKFMERKK
jgi:DNA replication protein DnaC